MELSKDFKAVTKESSRFRPLTPWTTTFLTVHMRREPHSARLQHFGVHAGEMTQSKAVFKVPDPEEMVVCPFDPVHVIRWKRFFTHVLKCEKQHPRSNLRRCRFFALHYVPAEQLEEHLTECPYAQAAFSEMASFTVTSTAANSVPTFYPRNAPTVCVSIQIFVSDLLAFRRRRLTGFSFC